MLAVLVLMVRLFGPGLSAAYAHVAPASWAGLGGAAICWAGNTRDVPAGQHPSKSPAHEHLLCPACQLAAQAALAVADRIVPLPAVALQPGKAAPLPTATGPPRPVRVAARPTGPPGSRT